VRTAHAERARRDDRPRTQRHRPPPLPHRGGGARHVLALTSAGALDAPTGSPRRRFVSREKPALFPRAKRVKLCLASDVTGGVSGMKKLGIAGLALAGLLVTSSVASAQVCAALLLITAGITSANEHRELTPQEAFWCGLYYDPDAKNAGKKAARKGKAKRVAKKE